MFNDLATDEVYAMVTWSADVPDIPTLFGHLDRMPKLRSIKVDRLFIDTNGAGVIRDLRDRGLDVFFDGKPSEIPTKLEPLAELHCSWGPSMINVMTESLSSGLLENSAPDKDDIDGLKRFADVCHKHGVRPCGVTVLTSTTEEMAALKYNGRSAREQVLLYVDLLVKCGFTDVVCSPQEVKAIMAEFKIDCNTPGVRPEGSASGDQARVGTPVGTLKAGAKRLVIGRPITNGDPAENLDNIVNSILVA